jgi:Fe-S-cluster containining protein
MLEPNLIQLIDVALTSAIVRSGPHLACRPGCAQCCYGVFEISALDAARLRRGLAAASPEVKARIEARLEATRAHLGPFFPGDVSTGLLAKDEEAVELFEEWGHADACPILDPETQTCDLYASRPVLCRTFGPPIRNDAEDLDAGLAICELCFVGATPGETLAAEMDSGFRTLQQQEETEYDAAHPGAGPTIIAFAFPKI